jgi:diguanylate cyclase (GGDEF)-like protein
MQTASGVNSQLYPNPDNAPAPETAARTVDSGKEQPAISELTAAAENFNAAFNTALYELETSRRLLKERAARIGELDASIAEINAALRTTVEEARRNDETRAAEAETLNRAVRDLEAEREQLRRELAEQRQALESQAAEIAALTARLAELGATLEQHDAESRRAAKAQAAEAHALKQIVRELESERDGLRQQVAEQQQAVEAQAGELAGLNARAADLNAELQRHELESRKSADEKAALQLEHDAVREQLARVQAELELRTGELSESVARIHALGAEIDVLTEAGQRREATHRQESERLQAERDSLNAELLAKDEQLQQNAGELEARSAEISSLGIIQGELTAHVEKLENLNRALQDSSASEKEMHRKIIAEKDSAISMLKARLETAARGAKDAKTDADTTAAMQPSLQALEQRLQASEAQARDLGERAAAADRLEAQVESLKRELQALQEGGATAAASLAAPEWSLDAGPAAPVNERGQFVAHLNHLLTRPGEEKVRHTLMYILLDNFIRVRDEIGVLQSARVLDETYTLIEACCGDSATIGRFGDCTFAVLCTDAGIPEVQAMAERIRSSVEKHIFEIDGHSLVITTSIGICALRGSDTDAEDAVARADLACESARLSGGNQVVTNGAASEEFHLPGHDRRAADTIDRILAEARLKIHYQPISNLKENTIDCFEVLTRVVDEHSNVILPGEFFALAVNSGKALEVDRHVIECALRKLAEKPNPDIKLFIKLTRDAVVSQDFPGWVSQKLDEYRINPGQLVFEVAEQVMESDLKSLSQLSRELNTIGCRIAIEHYRLETKPQHLRHIHPEYLKIDKGLVQNINRKGPGLAKVNEIMDLAKMNNLMTIAEGVETPACLAILWELGVTLAQGYLISEPSGSANFDVFDGGNDDEAANHGKAVFTIS